MQLLQLLWTFIIIGFFSFGGGYGMISFIQKEVVIKHTWITANEFTNMIAISQATPGPIAVNTATYVGYKIGGFWGACVANIGLIIPAFLLVISLVLFIKKYQKSNLLQHALTGLKPMTVALILGSGILLGIENILSIKDAILCAIALFLTSYLKVNPILVILGFGLLGVFVFA